MLYKIHNASNDMKACNPLHFHVGLLGSTILPHKIEQIKALNKPTESMSNNYI